MDYKEKLELAKDWYNDQSTTKKEKVLLETLFSELKESEDERIRKEILEYIDKATGCKDWLAWLEKQGETFTKRDVDDAWLKGICDAKRELEKQGEQKSADKVEPKFHEGDMIIHKELGGDYIHNSHKIIQVDILDKKYRLEGGLVAHFSEEDNYELVEQKSAWSKEDEHRIKDIIYFLDTAKKHYASTVELDACIDWLKSLKPQSHWKPTEEQLMALRDAIDNNEMESLYNDIKKL